MQIYEIFLFYSINPQKKDCLRSEAVETPKKMMLWNKNKKNKRIRTLT